MHNYIKYFFYKRRMLPIYLIFNATYKCNSRCITCFAWKDLENPVLKKELRIKEIKKISAGLKNIAWLLISGGEPFLREDLDEICFIFYTQNHARRITIPTNALLPPKIKIKTEQILNKCPKAKIVVSLSLDDIGKNHDRIRGVSGNFEKLIETYKNLAELKKSYKNLSINLNTVLSNKNVKNVKKITEYVSKNMKDVDFHGFELLRGSPRSSKLKTPSPDDYEKALKIIKEYWKKYDFYKMGFAKLIKSAKILARDIEFETLKTKKRKIPCYAGSISGVIGAYGDVQLCELLPKIGNLREFSLDFKKLWFSKEADIQRKIIKKRIGICSRCTHSCFVASTLLFDPLMYPRLIKNMFK